ncbi:MAG: hypothetical protein JST87_00135 [Bacteroidetes bacterium]|nr:hypothetical protein [Bacteroidota bacterium]
MKQFGYLVVSYLLLLSCNSSKITSSWKAENAEPKKYKKVLVLGLIKDNDRSLREKMEAQVSDNLKQHGFNAVCACDEFDPKVFENLTENEAIEKLRNSDIDGVLTIVLLDKTRERYYVPGRIMYTPYFIYRNHFWGYYSTMYGRIYSPGYYEERTKYFWESNFYDINSSQLLFSAQTRSFDPSSKESLSRGYGNLIVNDIIKKDILIQTSITKEKYNEENNQ